MGDGQSQTSKFLDRFANIGDRCKVGNKEGNSIALFFKNGEEIRRLKIQLSQSIDGDNGRTIGLMLNTGVQTQNECEGMTAAFSLRLNFQDKCKMKQIPGSQPNENIYFTFISPAYVLSSGKIVKLEVKCVEEILESITDRQTSRDFERGRCGFLFLLHLDQQQALLKNESVEERVRCHSKNLFYPTSNSKGQKNYGENSQ